MSLGSTSLLVMCPVWRLVRRLGALGGGPGGAENQPPTRPSGAPTARQGDRPLPAPGGGGGAGGGRGRASERPGRAAGPPGQLEQRAPADGVRGGREHLD